MPSSPVSAESLFHQYFLPLYPADARADLARARATDANPARNPSIVAHLGEAAELFVRGSQQVFGEDLALDYSDESVHRVSAALTRARRDAWSARGAAGTPENELFNVVVHGAAYVGACIVRGHGGAWSARRPLWESLVALTSRAGEAELAVFHWWLRSLADDALRDDSKDASDASDASDARTHAPTLADRYRAHVEIPCQRADELPVIFADPPTQPRKLARLAKVRYDLLYKYIKANLPELRDVGADFPSPERFDAYKFKWIDAHLLGGGRMVLFAGVNDHGAHLFWINSTGFEKAAFYPAEKFPEPVVKLEADKIQVIVSVDGKMQVHEMLWWGP